MPRWFPLLVVGTIVGAIIIGWALICFALVAVAIRDNGALGGTGALGFMLVLTGVLGSLGLLLWGASKW